MSGYPAIAVSQWMNAHAHPCAPARAVQSSGMQPEETEPTVLGCADMAHEGRWVLARCCKGCHEGRPHPGVIDVGLGPGGEPGKLRLWLCCAAGAAPHGGEYAKLLVEREA